MATVAPADATSGDEALYPIAVLIDELRNEDVQVRPLLCVDTLKAKKTKQKDETLFWKWSYLHNILVVMLLLLWLS